MSSARVYIGHLSHRASERDVEHFFKGYGRIREVVLKNGFGFVEFEDYRDADDAVYDLNGKDLSGDRVVLEHVRRPPKGRDADRFWGGGGGRGGPPPPRRNLRYPPPQQTRHRMIVENLSTRCSWQELKDMIRDYDLEVTFTDAHRSKRNEGIVCFANSRDLRKAMDKLEGKDINGRKIHLIDDSRDRSRSGSRGRSRSPRSRSRSRSPRGRSGSRSRSRSRSRTPRKRSRSRSASRDKSRSRSRSADSHHSVEKPANGDASPHESDRAASPAPVDSAEKRTSRSRSRSRSRSGSRSD